MSFERYIEFLQQIITMTDPHNSQEITYAKNILKNLMSLADMSGKAGAGVSRAMWIGYDMFDDLLNHKKDFAGKPGDFAGNRAKRHRLAMCVHPGC